MSEEFFLSKIFGESMQPSHVIPYYFRAVTPPKEEDITITTLITLDRFKVFDKLVTNYQGEARAYLEKLVEACGAKFTRNMTTSNTHLIAARSLFP